MTKVVDEIDGFYKRRFSALPDSFFEKKYLKTQKEFLGKKEENKNAFQ